VCEYVLVGHVQRRGVGSHLAELPVVRLRGAARHTAEFVQPDRNAVRTDHDHHHDRANNDDYHDEHNHHNDRRHDHDEHHDKPDDHYNHNERNNDHGKRNDNHDLIESDDHNHRRGWFDNHNNRWWRRYNDAHVSGHVYVQLFRR
jgi:hypothetical protein